MQHKIKNYTESIDYLYGKLALYQRDGKKAIKIGLENIIDLCNDLNNPQNNYPTIHIAGTNGKGSTAHMIAAILQAAGYRVGMYTSPHYRDFRERIKINGELIPKKKVTRFLNDNRSSIEEIWPTFFEITVAMAFDYFDQQKVDVAIIETGMGGRLDSTNIITPICSVITNISFDHQASLGYTLPAIAGEKAGIIKKEIPVIIGETHPETKPVFVQKASEQNTQISWADKEIQLKLIKKSIDYQVFDYTDNTKKLRIHLSSGGRYQIHNLKCALALINRIKDDYHVTSDHIKLGLSNLFDFARYIGRWQVLNKSPYIIADAAHNEAGIQELLAALDQLNLENLHIVFGMVKDKDPDKILSLLPINATYYFCAPKIPRKMAVEDLYKSAQKNNLKGKPYSSVGRALSAAKRRLSNQTGYILVTGSSYVVAEVV